MITANVEKSIIENNALLGLASLTPIFIFNQRLYYCKRGKASPDFFKKGEVKYALIPGPSMKVLDRISDMRLAGTYENYRERFVEEELKRLDLDAVSSGPSGPLDLIRFTMKEIFPHLRKDNSSGLADILEVGPDTAKESPSEKANMLKEENELDSARKKEIDKYIERRIGEIGVVKERSKMKNKLDMLLFENESHLKEDISLLAELIGESNFGICSDAAYSLVRNGSKDMLCIGGKDYGINYKFALSDLQMRLAGRIIKDLSIAALKDDLRASEAYKKIRDKLIDMEDICRKGRYHEQDFGFETISGNCLRLYVDVPEHALKSPHDGNIFCFRGHKLAIEIQPQGSGASLRMYPYGIGNEVEPFYHQDNAGLCMGSYNWTNRCEGMTPGKSLAMFLLDARRVVLSGYNSTAIRPRRRLDLSYYSSNLISEEEARRKGIPITNINSEFRVDGYRSY